MEEPSRRVRAYEITYITIISDDMDRCGKDNRVEGTVTRPLVGTCRNIYSIKSHSWSENVSFISSFALIM